MPVEFGIWKINGGVREVAFAPLDKEEKLEEVLYQEIGVLDPNLLVIGRQVLALGSFIDLLAIDDQGDLVVIELKRDKTPREVVAQTLDYASWVQNQTYDDVLEIFATKNEGQEFEEAFFDRFGSSPPETLNENHRLIIVAGALDDATERIISYLAGQYGVPINAVFFRYFTQGGDEFLARSWLIEPTEVVAATSLAAAKKSKKEPWNRRDFYVSLGESEQRNWDDCRRYGFISAGQGAWYSGSLGALFVGARVFVNIPKTGYVGAGIVEETVQPVNRFTVEVNGREIPILEAPLKAPSMDENSDDPKLAEHLVRVRWIETRDREEAIWEKGMFANQNSACKLRNRFTLERLYRHFGLDE